MKHAFFPLVGYELRKAFFSPGLLIFLVLLLAVNGWKLHTEFTDDARERSQYQTLYNEFYTQWNGPITPEKVTDLMDIYGPLEEKAMAGALSYQEDPNTYTGTEFSDYRFFHGQFANEMRYDYLYQNEGVRITQRALELAGFYTAAGNTFETRKNLDIAARFAGRQISNFADTQAIETWLEYDYSSMLVLLLSLFGLCSVFVTERETEMYMLLRTTRRGSAATAAAKLTASSIFILVICGLFFWEDVLVLQLLNGRSESLSSPVYAIRYFESTPLTMTIGQYQLFTVAAKTLGILCSGLLILLLSCLCRRVLTTYILSFGALMGLIILQEFCRTRFWLKWFNPLELVMVRELVTETKYVDFFGLAVPLHFFLIFGILLTMGLLILGILRCDPGHTERRNAKC